MIGFDSAFGWGGSLDGGQRLRANDPLLSTQTQQTESPTVPPIMDKAVKRLRELFGFGGAGSGDGGAPEQPGDSGSAPKGATGPPPAGLGPGNASPVDIVGAGMFLAVVAGLIILMRKR